MYIGSNKREVYFLLSYNKRQILKGRQAGRDGVPHSSATCTDVSLFSMTHDFHGHSCYLHIIQPKEGKNLMILWFEFFLEQVQEWHLSFFFSEWARILSNYCNWAQEPEKCGLVHSDGKASRREMPLPLLQQSPSSISNYHGLEVYQNTFRESWKQLLIYYGQSKCYWS